jgi:elongation factor Ts
MIVKIDPKDVARLREATGAGVMDCKRALEQAHNDLEKAKAILREQGLDKAKEKVGRAATQGVVAAYVHAGKQGALVELNSETDFVARNESFQEFARKVAMQVASARDLRFVSEVDIPDEFRVAELDIYRAKASAEGRPEAMLDKIAEGMFRKSLVDTVLLHQPSIHPDDEGKTIDTLRAELSGTLGENVEIKRFARFEVGAA